MLISNSSALNILLANNNKLVNDVLKEADTKSLDRLFKQDTTSSTNDIGKVLKEIFNNIKDGTKSASTLENMLKNSTIFKELGNVSTNIASLLDDIQNDETLQKFKPLLENILKNIKDIDSNNLKNQLKNSGIFLENKLTTNQNLKLENILQNILATVKNIDLPQIKEINNLINEILKNVSNSNITNNTNVQNQANNQILTNLLKDLTTSLQNLSQTLNSPATNNLTILIKDLKTIITQGSLIESKIENSSNSLQQQSQIDTKTTINNQVKELLTQIKNDFLQNSTLLQNKNILPLIDNLLKMPDIFVKNDNLLNSIQNQQIQQNISNFANNVSFNLTPLLNILKDNLEALPNYDKKMQNHMNNLIKKVENIIQEHINNINEPVKQATKFDDDFKSILLKMQDEVASKTDAKSQEILKNINNLLTQIDYHQLTSIVSNSNFVYIPFFWDMLEDGSIEMKQKDEEKFFCQIKLTLKDFGKVDLMLSLYDENRLDLTVYAQREHFKIALRDNLQKLKLALNSVDLIPVNIKLLDMKDEKTDETKPSNIYQNAYNDSANNFGLTVNIKA